MQKNGLERVNEELPPYLYGAFKWIAVLIMLGLFMVLSGNQIKKNLQ